MTATHRFRLADAAASRKFGAALAQTLRSGCIHWRGELGAGKTTCIRGLLHARGHDGPVRSPTYTLLEPYELDAGVVVHLDLYRLGDPEEVVMLGLDDWMTPGTLVLVEWPERGEGVIPPPDLTVALSYDRGRGGDEDAGRVAELQALSAAGRDALTTLASHG